MAKESKNKITGGHKPTEVGKELVKRLKDLNHNVEQIMQTKTTYFGQHFHLSLVSGDKNVSNLFLFISSTDETHNYVVPIDKYELKDVADFIYKYLGDE